VEGEDFVRFTQTAGGRPGIPAPRLVKAAPFVKTEGPAVWTTLALTIYADGSTGYEFVGASSFPRHWIYDSHGKLAGKSALIDFKTWYRTAGLARSPWRGHENEVLGERASLEHGRRTATVRAVTNCRIVSYLAADLSPKDLRELAAGHHREDQQQ